MEPQKPFLCSILDCGMTFTNEDRLQMHTTKHDMVLQLGTEQKAAFVDQTPTPTRFIRNCEEVGLFQELQNVNPFDEGFRKAMETKACMLSLEGGGGVGGGGGGEELHTPHVTMYHNLSEARDTGSCHRNVTISRSSSDESGAVKEYETTTISKLRNEVTTISRLIPHTAHSAHTATQDDTHGKGTVSYTNNVIQIHSNVAIRKQSDNSYMDQVKDDVLMRDVMLTDAKLQVPAAPLLSQKSIDRVVDSLTDIAVEDRTQPLVKMIKRNYASAKKENEKAHSSNTCNDKRLSDSDDYEVIIKLPNQKYIRMKAVEDNNSPEVSPTKESLKRALKIKAEKIAQAQEKQTQNASNIVPIAGGTLFPVTIVNPVAPILLTNSLQKIPIPVDTTSKPAQSYKKTVRRKKESPLDTFDSQIKPVAFIKSFEDPLSFSHQDSRSAASRRYRERLKHRAASQRQEAGQLREVNLRLAEENRRLKHWLLNHRDTCNHPEDYKSLEDLLKKTDQK